MKLQEDEEFQPISKHLNNISKMIEYQKNQYIILFKRQKDRKYLTLYLSDCGTTYWIQKITTIYCQKMKLDLQIKSNLQNFMKMFAKGVQQTVSIKQLKPKPIIQVSIQISQGITMKCILTLDIQISNANNPEQYLKLNKNFFKQLFEAKQQEINQYKINFIDVQKDLNNKKNAEKSSKDPTFVSTVLKTNQKNYTGKKSAIIPQPKNRDLVNPNKKRRKNLGIKYQDP